MIFCPRYSKPWMKKGGMRMNAEKLKQTTSYFR